MQHDAAAGNGLFSVCWPRCGAVVRYGLQGRAAGGAGGCVSPPNELAAITVALIQALAAACQAGGMPVVSKDRS